MDKIEYGWILKTTQKEFSELRSAFLEAKYKYKEILEELAEEKELMIRIESLIKELDEFERDFDIVHDSYEFPGMALDKRLEDIHGAVIKVEKDIEELRQKIKKFESREESNLKKSQVMERKIDYVENMMKKIKELLRF
jgi:hypothetical protein